jgi:hypothetical protein
MMSSGRERSWNPELREQGSVHMTEHMPTHSGNFGSIACRIDIPLEEIAIAERFLIPCCENQIIWTTWPKVTPLAERDQYKRTHRNLSLGRACFHRRECSSIVAFDHAKDAVLQIDLPQGNPRSSPTRIEVIITSGAARRWTNRPGYGDPTSNPPDRDQGFQPTLEYGVSSGWRHSDN